MRPTFLTRMLRIGKALTRQAALGCWIGGCWIGTTSAAAGGVELSGDFVQANRLYETGRYAEAAQLYQRLADRGGGRSTVLHFNLGNARFKSGQIGRAIYHYRRAEHLSPRDPDVQANLRFARRSVEASARPAAGWLTRALTRLSADEWAILTTAALWLWLGLLAARELKPDWKRALRGYTATAGAVAGLVALSFAVAVQGRAKSADAIVVVKEMEVRYGPLPESKAFYSVRDGTELRVVAEKGDWLQVADASQRIGWALHKDVLRLPVL